MRDHIDRLPSIKANRQVLSVSALTCRAKQLLEGEFPNVFVEGELSNFATPASGHWYFTLKDAASQIRSVMFKGRNRLLRFVPRNGLQIVVRGRISLYTGRGDFQMIAEHIEEAGDGALKRAFEALKEKLTYEGLFTQEVKQPVPGLVRHLVIITSPTGAAIADVLHVLKRRFAAMQVTVIPVRVQGDASVQQITHAIGLANETHYGFDVILLTRGGGSLEDMWSFNTEPVARAIVASRLPVVSAVGHETDVSIADFVADVRAPTPSAAAEMLSPDTAQWLSQLQQSRQRLVYRVQSKQKQLRQRLDDLEARLRSTLQPYLNPGTFKQLGMGLAYAVQHQLKLKHRLLAQVSGRIINPTGKILAFVRRLQHLEQVLNHQQELAQINRKRKLSHLMTRLDAISPLKILQRGYAIATKSDATLIRHVGNVKPGEQVNIRLRHSRFTARVISTDQIDDA